MTAAPVSLRLCVTKPVLRQAPAFSATIVGSVLILINYGDVLFRASLTAPA